MNGERILSSGTPCRGLVNASMSSHGFHLHGTFKNYNTIEEFKSPEAKKAVFDKVADEVSGVHSFPAPHRADSRFFPLRGAVLQFLSASDLRGLKEVHFPLLVRFPSCCLETRLASRRAFRQCPGYREFSTGVANLYRKQRKFEIWAKSLITELPR